MARELYYGGGAGDGTGFCFDCGLAGGRHLGAHSIHSGNLLIKRLYEVITLLVGLKLLGLINDV